MDILIDFDPRLNRMQISNPSAGNRESRGAVTRLYNFYEEGFKDVKFTERQTVIRFR